MAWYEQKMRPIPVQVARNFAFYALLLAALVTLFDLNDDGHLLDATGWKRLALIGLPIILVASTVEAFAERARTRLGRALGRGLANAMVLIVMLNGDRIAAGTATLRMERLALALPVLALISAVPLWMRDERLPTTDSTSSPAA